MNLEKRYLKRFLDFGSSQVFEDATVYTGCQLFTKKEKDYFFYHKIDAKKFNASICWTKINFDTLRTSNWSLGNKLAVELMDKISATSRPLGEVAEIFVGIQTSADIVYHLKKIEDGLYYSKILNTSVEIENEIMKPLISGPEAKKYKYPETEKFLLHPYKTDNDFSLIDENEFLEKYPKAFKYLKQNESFLRAREKNKMNHDKWYAFNYPKNLEKQTLPKIGVAQTVSRLQCFLDDGGNVFLNNVRVNGISPIIPGLEIKYLLALLNSKLLDFCFKLVGKPKDNGFYEANKQFISNLPIIIPNASYQDKIIDFVEKILDSKRSNKNKSILEYENHIDQLVYELYGLTEEEIRIVEGGGR
ncbi:hypothetical protein EF405_16130 [Cyclobacteriaceae bacterium YHN15]|nr:hypothetical protein EF405_16130 [Cyclobacteriaceae bacterium YHN15]